MVAVLDIAKVVADGPPLARAWANEPSAIRWIHSQATVAALRLDLDNVVKVDWLVWMSLTPPVDNVGSPTGDRSRERDRGKAVVDEGKSGRNGWNGLSPRCQGDTTERDEDEPSVFDKDRCYVVLEVLQLGATSGRNCTACVPRGPENDLEAVG
jgi:hypothetical protein